MGQSDTPDHDGYKIYLYLDKGADIKNVLVELVNNMPEVANVVAFDGKLTVKRASASWESAGVIDLRYPTHQDAP